MRKTLIFVCFLLVFSCKKSDEGNPETSIEVEIPNTPPTVPLKVYPTNGLLCTENPLEFRWNSSSDKDGDAISYEIEIARDDAFTDIVEKTSVTATTKMFTLEKGIELSWRVRAKDDQNSQSDYTPNWKFYTEGEGVVNYLPFTPTLINPTLNTKVSNNKVVLEWTSSDVDGESLLYDIYFGGTTPPPLIKENSMDKTFEISVDSDQTYYWQVIAKDSNGGEAIGNIWIFKS